MPEQHWHARVDDAVPGPEGGSGFLVDSRHVLTCAHVVKAMRAPQVTFTTRNDGPIPATVVEPGQYDPDGPTGLAGDVAVLRLERDPDPAIKPARFAPFTALRWGPTEFLLAHGFPAAYPEGDTAEIRLVPGEVPLYGELRQIVARSLQGASIDHGYSGAAVYFQGSGDVVGIVTSVDHATEKRKGLMLPADKMLGYWPALADRVSLGPFAPAQYRDLRQLTSDFDAASPLVLFERAMTGLSLEAPRGGFESVQEMVEFVIAGGLRPDPGIVLRWASGVLQVLAQCDSDIGRRARLADWVRKHCWQAEEPSNTGPAAVIVEIDQTGTARDLFRVTIYTLRPPGPGKLEIQGEVWRKDVRRWVEERLAGYLETFAEDTKVFVEFVLPPDWLLAKPQVDEWASGPDDDAPLSWAYPVVVRDLRRFKTERYTRFLRQRWRSFDRQGPAGTVNLHWIECGDPRSPRELRAYLQSSEDRAAVALTSEPPGTETIHAAIVTGVPVMLWPRVACPGGCAGPTTEECNGVRFRAELVRKLRGVAATDLPEKIRTLRTEAAQNEHDLSHCGRALTLLWDHPDHRPSAPPLGLRT